MVRFISLAVLLILCLSCRTAGTRDSQATGTVSWEVDSMAIYPRYAKGFRWEQGGKVLVLSDPWNPGKVFARYCFSAHGDDQATGQGTVQVKVPVLRIAASSTTHAGFLTAIGAGDLLIGINNPERLYNSDLYRRYKEGTLRSIGRDMEYNLEFLIAQKPDVVLQSGIEGQFKPDPRLTEAGIPVLYILEWMESTPLGRAEWIRVFGFLTGRIRQADSLFNLVEDRYLELKQKAQLAGDPPKVLTGNNFKGTWYMPGGRNYLAHFFRDAGLDYPYKETSQSASLALNFEAVVNSLADAPIWIGVPVDSLSQLLAEEQRYSIFRSIREQKVYAMTNRINNHGGNDYWEGAVVRPDLILADLLYIAHPALLPGHIWNFYKPIIFN